MVTLKEWIRRLTERLSLSFLAVIVLGWFIYTCITRWRKRNDHLHRPGGGAGGDALSPDESTTVTPVSPPADSGLAAGIHNSYHHNHANGDPRHAGPNSSVNGSNRHDSSARPSSSSRGVSSSSRSSGANRSHRHANGAPRSSANRHSNSERQRRSPGVVDDVAVAATTTTTTTTTTAQARREEWRRAIDTSDDMTIDAGTPPPSYESVCDDPPSYNQVFTEAKK